VISNSETFLLSYTELRSQEQPAPTFQQLPAHQRRL